MAEPTASERLAAVDATRGAAMLFVCLSHFADAYFKPFGYGRQFELVDRLVMVASPTFMIMSGAMLGLLHAQKAARFAAVRAKLLDRGVFLLLVAHLLIAVAHVPFVGAPAKVLRWGFITDAIGVALILGPRLVSHLRPAARVAVGAATYVLSWLAVYAWQPTTLALRLAKDALIGPAGESSWEYTFPVLPWFGLYFASTALGAWLAQRAATQRTAGIARVGATAGLVSIAIAGVLHVGVRLPLVAHRLSPGMFEQARELTATVQKIPPGPCYVLAYGGAGLLLAAACFAASERKRYRPLLWRLELLGRSSLFVFVLHYYIYYTVLYLLRLPYTPLWPLYFLGSLALLFPIVKTWERRRGNRLITVGLARR
jgi:uncharacterized membrane protein